MDMPLTDCGNARRFARMFGDKMRYNRKSGKWLAWDGKRWDESGGEEKAQLYCRGVAMELWKELGGTEPGDKRKKLYRHWTYTESASGIRNLLFVAKSEPGLAISPSDLNQDLWLLNCLDGTVDLRTGESKKHDPNDMITQLAQVECNASDTSISLWEATLNQWHPNDPETLDYLQRLAGSCLTGSIASRCMPIFWGGGHNGKNVFIETLMAIMGDYAGKVPDTLLEATGRDEHPTEIADLWGKRLMFASEPKKGTKLKINTVKAITGDKELKGRYMHRDFFSFKNTTKIIMATQHMPTVEEDTDAIWGRLYKIKWGQKFEGAKRDTYLGEKLMRERAGILQWAISGCLKWKAADCQLIPTAMIQTATQEYRVDQNPIHKFLECGFMLKPALTIPVEKMKVAWITWQQQAADCEGVTTRTFNALLRDLGLFQRTKKVNDEPVRCWFGIGARYEEK